MNQPKVPILIIEDDHDIRVCFRQALESYNFQIFSATNGKDAIILMKSLKEVPKLIISDLSMPFMDGNEFVFEKNKNEKFKDIPVLIVSAHTQKACIEGKVEVLSKPVDLDKFVSKVQECVSQRHVNTM